MRDQRLLQAWRDALQAAGQAGLLRGKTVLDLGCGLGMLSLLAATVGAAVRLAASS